METVRDDLWRHTHCSQVRGNDTKVDFVDDASDKPTKRSDQDPVDESLLLEPFLLTMKNLPTRKISMLSLMVDLFIGM